MLRQLLLATALSLLLIASAAAQPAPAPPVDELIAEALARTPSIAAMRARLAAAREMVAPAGALPDPMVELMLQNESFPSWTVGSEPMSMIGPEVRQGLSYPGKLRARRAAAEAEVDLRRAELSTLQRMVVREVRVLYARLFTMDREREALLAGDELVDLLAETVTARYAVGGTTQEAVLKAQIERSRLAERLDDLDAERAETIAMLNRLLDRPAGTRLGPIASIPAASLDAQAFADRVVASSAEVAARRSAIELARRRLEVSRTDLKPDLFAGAGVGLRGGFDPVVTLRIGAELPLWRRTKQEPMVRAAEREVEMAEAELREAESAARAEADRLAASWLRSERQVRRYREAIVPQSSAAMDAARSEYLAGRGDFSTVIEDFRIWLDARAELARREAERFATWAEAEALTAAAAASDEGDAQ